MWKCQMDEAGLTGPMKNRPHNTYQGLMAPVSTSLLSLLLEGQQHTHRQAVMPQTSKLTKL